MLDSAILSQVAFPGESNQNFPWEKPQWDNTVVKKYALGNTGTRNDKPAYSILKKIFFVAFIIIKIGHTSFSWKWIKQINTHRQIFTTQPQSE